MRVSLMRNAWCSTSKADSYRLVAAIDYPRRALFVKWLGSHKEYDKIDVRTVQYGNQAYQKRP